MAKKYFHKKVHTVKLYKGKLVIIFTNSKKKLKKHLPDFEDGELYAHCYYANYKNYDGFFVVLNFDRKISNQVIIHEVIHCANFILDKRGVVCDFSNDEPLTYLAEWISKKIYKFARKKKMKIK